MFSAYPRANFRLTFKDIAALFLCGGVLPFALGILFIETPVFDWLAYSGATSTSQIHRWLHTTFDRDWIVDLLTILVYAAMGVAIQFVILNPKKVGWRDLGFTLFHWKWAVAGIFIFAAEWALEDFTVRQFGLEQEMERIAREYYLPTNINSITVATALLMSGPATAVFEEVSFRGLLYRWMRQYANIPICVLTSAALFAVIHIYLWDPGGIAGLAITGVIFMSGVAYALLYEWSRSLLPSILLHAISNMVAVSFAVWDV